MASGYLLRDALSNTGSAAQSAGRCHDRSCHYESAAGLVGGVERRMAFLVSDQVPCILFEDEHLLVVNKPAGLNTHAPAPFASEGIYDWLRHGRERWGDLTIVQRLDKETSGLIVFPKTALANRSLAEQFAVRSVRKTYLLLTDRPVPKS